MKGLLYLLARNGDISWLSYYFAEFICRQSSSTIDEQPALYAALLSNENQSGSACIALDEFVGQPLFSSRNLDPDSVPRGIEVNSLRNSLIDNHCFGEAEGLTPIIIDGNRLYLNRFWNYEKSVSEKILARLNSDEHAQASIATQFDLQFSGSPGEHDQKVAISMAAAKTFSVISGGPGSGKTTTVIKILSCLITQQKDIRIALAAPTGKAAARMVESIRSRIDDLDIDDGIRALIPQQASTIHRLLGYRHNGYFYNRDSRLPYDCIVIDEASMVDLTLCYHLFQALRNDARIILLGDRDQLSSVAAGNVLGDITGHGQPDSPKKPLIADAIALLGHSYRFSSDSGIAELATFVNEGQSAKACDLLGHERSDIYWYDYAEEQLQAELLEYILENCQTVFASTSVEAALHSFARFRVLSATNQGPLGVDQLNRLISSQLLLRNNQPLLDYYQGLPVMITRNHHDFGLYNGDTGILWDQGDGLKACFYASGSDEIRRFTLNRLADLKPAWVTTVHKSQGSEFNSVVLILPDDSASAVLSRELVYTAITRAKEKFVMQATAEVFTCAVDTLTKRHSGLAERLGWQLERT